jgi:hypothetical protein
LSTHDDEQVLGVFLDREDGWERHTESFGVNSAREVTEWVKERISGKLDGVQNFLKSKPKSSGKLKIEAIQVLGFEGTVEVIVTEPHGKKGIFKNVVDSVRVIF